MKSFLLIYFSLYLFHHSQAQYKHQLSLKVSIAVNANVETYFFAEKVAVERINNFVFDNKGSDYSHQPIVYFAFERFQKYKDSPVIIKIGELLVQLREIFHDNAQIIYYLVDQKEFPQKGPIRGHAEMPESNDVTLPGVKGLLSELTDSLRSFYTQANVGKFLKESAAFYHGALKEVEKDISVPAFVAMEDWYGKRFPQYHLYIAPSMPISAGDDNYRGMGQEVSSKEGKIPAMIISSNRMLPLLPNLSAYKQYGFDNQAVTYMLTKHEIGHSFVNPMLETFASALRKDSTLYTSELKAVLAPHYINDWYVCVIEHLVRLGEIRTAMSANDFKEADRLRRLHIREFKCVLIPLLETKIKEYESNRKQYPNLEGYLSELIAYLHGLTPAVINTQIDKYKNYEK